MSYTMRGERCVYIGNTGHECGGRYDTADALHGIGFGQHFPSDDAGSIPPWWVDSDGKEHTSGRESEIVSVCGINPRCDICGKAQQPEDEWNGDTGNHRACEERRREE